MNWELILSLAGTAGALVLAFLYARAERKAAVSDQLATAVDGLKLTLEAAHTVLVNKEEYIRELEKTVLGSLPAGKLVDRLNLMFSACRNQSPGPLPTAKPTADPADD